MNRAAHRAAIHASHLLGEQVALSADECAASCSSSSSSAAAAEDFVFAEEQELDLSGLLSLDEAAASASSSSSSRFAASLKKDTCPKRIGLLNKFMNGPKFADIRDATREMLDRLNLDPLPGDLKLDEERLYLRSQIEAILPNLPVRLTDLRDAPDKFWASMEIIAFFAPQVITKMAVQYGLWGGTIMNLGGDRHQKLVPDIENYNLPGCFLMTEIGHGSNVRGIETTATYDKRTREFIINSPTFSSKKYWIGNAAHDALSGTCFARLILDGKDYGVHTFIVPLRDGNGNVVQDVVIEDCGIKMGINGVDNGCVQFNNLRIPRENMLNRFSEVMENGEYRSRFSDEGKHFGATVGELTGGRVLLGCGAASIAKLGLTIAIRFGWSRRQFGPEGGAEVPIMTYPTHQIRLMPPLANAIVYGEFGKLVAELYTNKTEESGAIVHAYSAFYKACAGWSMCHTLQQSRECCGGQGFRAKNRVGILKSDTDVFLTYEGDNTVLMQQTARFLLNNLASMTKANRFTGVLEYLPKLSEVTAPAGTPVERWTCPKFLTYVFQAREKRLLTDLGRKLSSLQSSGVSSYDAFQQNLNRVVELGHAFCDRVVTEHFRKVIADAPAEIKDLLVLVANLDALSRIRPNLGALVSFGVVSAELGRVFTDAFEALAHQLAPYSLDICDAFRIPQCCLPRSDLLETP